MGEEEGHPEWKDREWKYPEWKDSEWKGWNSEWKEDTRRWVKIREEGGGGGALRQGRRRSGRVKGRAMPDTALFKPRANAELPSERAVTR